jgi:hypothetical protein
LNGKITPSDQRRIGRLVDVYYEEGKSFITINDLPKNNLEAIIRKIKDTGLRRLDRSFDLGVMPKHKDGPEERIAAFRLMADDIALPANPKTDFANPTPYFQSCGWLKPSVLLQTFRKPLGHMAMIGLHEIVDQGLADFMKSRSPKISFGDVLLKGKKIDWRQILELGVHAKLLDPALVFEPSAPCATCGTSMLPLRSTLIAHKEFKMNETELLQNSDFYGHDGKQPIFILSLDAAQKLKSKYRSGYVLTPIYAADSPIAEYVRMIDKMLDEHIPASTKKLK